MKRWPREAYKWYRSACDMFNYPAGPYGDSIKTLVASGDTVLDLGCGIGAASIMMAQWCKLVIALDQDEDALARLEVDARERGVTNIVAEHGSWPLDKPLRSDIVVALHVSRAMRSFPALKRVFESADKGGFIACQASVPREDESFRELKEELGITPNYRKCDNGCYTRGCLEALGAQVTCEKKVYEFGQPLDTLEEAVRFISWQIGADDSMIDTVKKRVDRYTHKTGGKYLVPITRHSCGIGFVK